MSEIYRSLLLWLLNSPEEENMRTGHHVKVGRGGTSFRLDLSDRILPTVGSRKLFPKSAAAETAWYIHGEQDVAWMRRHAPLWDKFVEADGQTVLAAYGYRWRKHFGRDQLDRAMQALARDRSDRRVFISAWDPATDGLGAAGQRNVPCPVAFNLHISEDALHSTLMLRSSDVFVGLPYDVMGHAFLMDAIASSLDVDLGVLHVSLAHAHLYEDHYELAKTCVNASEVVVPKLELPGWTVRDIELDRDSYVAGVAFNASKAPWPEFNPKPFVVE
jgi:thymidylate synthase